MVRLLAELAVAGREMLLLLAKLFVLSCTQHQHHTRRIQYIQSKERERRFRAYKEAPGCPPAPVG